MQRKKLKRKQQYLRAYTWHQYWAGYHALVLEHLIENGGSLEKYNRHRAKYERHAAAMSDLDEKEMRARREERELDAQETRI